MDIVDDLKREPDVHDREGLAQALGIDKAQSESKRLVDRALKQLEPFGGRAAVLRQLAEWLASTA
jgi:hypothetical protein